MTAILLAPHNDDETLFASFLCLRYKPHVIVCLRSDRMASPNYPHNMPIAYETRVAETDKAMEIFGCTWEQWQHSDDTPDWEALERDLSTLQPSLLIAPALEIGGHAQHNQIADFSNNFTCKKIHYMTYTQGRIRSFSENEFIPRPEWVPLKLRALACYESQIAHPMTGHHFLGSIREYIL